MNRSAFLAVIPASHAMPEWLPQVAEALHRRHGLVGLVEAPGMKVFGNPGAAHLLTGRKDGIVWGHLFDRRTGLKVKPEELDKTSGLRLQDLLDGFWGGYVALLNSGATVDIARDPSGAMACYHAAIEGTHLVTSRPDLLFELGLLRPQIDWGVIAQSLIYSDIRPARTALRCVSELLPGVELRISGGRAESRCAWSPWDYAAKMEVPDATEAVARLRKVAAKTLDSWGSCFQRPLVEISGGLDSAIVAAGISSAAREARCVTFGPWKGDPDELPWARAVTSHLGLPLDELALALDDVDVTRSDAAHLPRPCTRFFSQALDRPLQELARNMNADAFFGGGGGDSIFFHLQSALPVVDRVRQEGFGLGAFRTAADVAQIAQTDTWTVLATAFRRWRRRASAYPTPMPNSFVAAHVRNALPWPADNPWLEAPLSIAPGRQRQVWAVMTIQNHLEGYGREAVAPFISPLMSQPLLETCFSFPTWLWCEGGRNRALARDAFRAALPRMVIERRTKGSFNRLVTTLLERNRARIREMLHEGALARERFLDLAAVDACLDGSFPEHDALSQFMVLVDHEAWAASWEGYSGARPT